MKESKKPVVRFFHAFLSKYFPNSIYIFYIFIRSIRVFKKKTLRKKIFTKFSTNLSKINENEFKITSQNNEDGIIEYIFETISNNKHFVEIGFEFHEFNSLNLIKKNWGGRLIDFNTDEVLALKSSLFFYHRDANVDILNERITTDNINELVFYKNYTKEIDFFSLDIDGNDYWVLKAMDVSRIKIICCEYNHWLGSNLKLSMKYNPNFNFVDNGIFGASLLAITDLLKEKNFSLIAVDSSGTNAFFVNNTYAKHFEILCPKKSFISLGRFYSEDKKKEIFKNIKQSKLFIQV